jgi:ParB/RepB/Spo0J family partition protein
MYQWKGIIMINEANKEADLKVKMIDIQLLHPHPRNKDIYGEEDIKELADQITKSGYVKPIIINKNNMVISGHRRMYACLYLGEKYIPFTREKFKDENEELERLLIENQYREKTMTQKAEEGKLWEEIESKKAKQRQLSGLNNQSVVVDNVPQRENGKSRDIIAEKVGIGSGRTYERAKVTVEKINNLKKEHREKDVEFLTTILNESVRGAKDLSKDDIIDKISEEMKDKVIKKEIPVQKAVVQIRKELGILTDNNKNQNTNKINNEIEKIETKVCKKCGKEKSILEFYKGKNVCKDCFDESNRKSKKPKDVYGNYIEIDEEKIKNLGVDIQSVIDDVKNTDKSVHDIDYNSISMELECNFDMFAQNIEKYTDGTFCNYTNIDKDNKNKILNSISNVEIVINKLKNILI